MAAGVVVATLAAAAHAGITDPGLTFTATNANGTGTLSVPLASGAPLPGGGWQWVLTGPPLNIMSPGNVVLGTVSQGSITMNDNGGIVAITFAATAGGAATNFQVNSALVSFSPVGNPQARASAGLTVTDNNGDGASVTGNRPGGTHYSAHYNGLAPAGSAFANLIAGPLVEPNAFGSEASSQSFPAAPGAFSTIVGSVQSMSAAWDFTLTAGDQASGTSVFVIIPAPAGLGLLGVAGLALGSRRRS
jgi:MYXO-CTERM domain-containing protein